ncbi:MAG: hypothetical protein KDD92_03550 [Caldilineaceae bacterium]|nr:hypothetical protein [Caldilineaceae bacterium]
MSQQIREMELTRPTSLRMTIESARFRQSLFFLLGAVLFATAYGQWPLYSENQHTKFLHGLAAAGYGQLRHDWLANTIDPLPAFSALVAATYALLPTATFYLYHGLLLGLLLFSLISIANRVLALNRTKIGPFLFAVLLIALFAGRMPPFSWPVLGTSWSWLLQAGVANQYLINPVFQPSSFGVLLITSIALFLADRPYAAAAAAALAAVMHSTYLPTAGVLTLAYMVILLRQTRDWRRALITGLIALGMVLPIILYSVLRLGPTAPELWQEAQAIIVHYRIPHHSLPEIWLDRTVYVKIALFAVALWIVRRTRLAPIMALAGAVAILLTIWQMIRPNDTLAFVAPWRISATLVPLSSALVLAWATAALCKLGAAIAPRLRRLPYLHYLLWGMVLIIALVEAAQGVQSMSDAWAARRTDSRRGLYEFVETALAPTDQYLIPTGMAEFRLETGAPALVTFKSHPYRDVEVIEWRSRMDAAGGFYNNPTCEGLLAVSEAYALTHVVLEPQQLPDGCPALQFVYIDNAYRVAAIVP